MLTDAAPRLQVRQAHLVHGADACTMEQRELLDARFLRRTVELYVAVLNPVAKCDSPLIYNQAVKLFHPARLDGEIFLSFSDLHFQAGPQKYRDLLSPPITRCCRVIARGRVMPIVRLLAEASFDQADIQRMTSAYEAALQLLRLNDRNDPLCELIAAKIIQVFRSGETDPPRICARTLKELGVELPK